MDHILRVNGKMVNDMVSVLRPVIDGYIVVNGLVDLKDAMVLDKVLHRRQNMREHGRVDYRMAMVQRHMPMEVSFNLMSFLFIYFLCIMSFPNFITVSFELFTGMVYTIYLNS